MSEGGYRTSPAHRGPSAIRLVWVYPDLLSTYGDRGNLLVLDRRARLRGFGRRDRRGATPTSAVPVARATST